MNIEDLANYFASATISFEHVCQQVILSKDTPTTKESSHNCASILIILTGSARFTINQTPYELHTGSVFHVGPSMTFSEEVLSDTKCSYILIHYRILEVERFSFYTSHFSMDIDNQKKLVQCAMELEENFNSADTYMKLKCKSLLLNLFVELIHALKNDSSKQSTIDLETIKSYIHQHYAESISINDIAINFGIKRRYLTAVFQRYIGSSPIEYLTACRIHKAQELLVLTDKQILEISNIVGYVDNLYFSRVFKKKTGMSPTEYRKYKSHLSMGKANQD